MKHTLRCMKNEASFMAAEPPLRICKANASFFFRFLFTFGKDYAIIQPIDKLEFGGRLYVY